LLRLRAPGRGLVPQGREKTQKVDSESKTECKEEYSKTKGAIQ